MTTKRQDYLDGRISHADYYDHLAREIGLKIPADHAELPRVIAVLKAGDQHLNTIPMDHWDAKGAGLMMYNGKQVREAFKAAGDNVSDAGLVSLIKRAWTKAALDSGAVQVRRYVWRGEEKREFARFQWATRDVFAAIGDDGQPTGEPWMTRQECKEHASRDGVLAEFVTQTQVALAAPDSLYDRLLLAGIEMDHHESDLYVLATAEAQTLIARSGVRAASTFVGTDGRHWIEVPFMYAPWWREKGMNA